MLFRSQNPIEQEGTYPLPEAQLDRFMFNVKVGYPTLDEEKKILALVGRGEMAELTRVLSSKAIVAIQKIIHTQILISDKVNDYVARLVRATRPDDPTAPEFVKRMVDWGAGPRAGIFLEAAGKAFAAMDGRPTVSEDDILKAAIPVLRHRISTNFQAQAEGKSTDDIVRQLLATVRPAEEERYVRPRR